MSKHKFGLILFVWLLSVMIIMPLSAQVEEEIAGDAQTEESEESQGGVMDSLFKALGSAAQESMQEGIEDFIGTYKGRIDEVRLLERRGNSVVFDVKYDGVKRKDGVYVEGEVLQWGEPLDGFSSTLSPIQGKKGTVRLTIGWKGEDDSGWGISSESVTSDQIRLSLVRETNPERPFGSLIYDFPKEWTSSSDIEIPEEITESETADTEDAIDLAEGETYEETQPVTPGSTPVKPSLTVTRPGAVLKPVQTAPVSASSSAGTSAAQSASSSTQTMTPAKPLIKPAHVVTEYNFYENAGNAKWKNATADLPFPGAANDNRGFVRTLKEGKICPNNKARNLLQTHPQWVDRGIIEGRYPAMILGDNVKFKAVGALFKGAGSSDGVIMSVSVLANGRLRNVIRKRVNCSAYVPLEADLSAWAGKKVQIVLHVRAGKTSAQDWAVWVNPRLENK